MTALLPALITLIGNQTRPPSRKCTSRATTKRPQRRNRIQLPRPPLCTSPANIEHSGFVRREKRRNSRGVHTRYWYVTLCVPIKIQELCITRPIQSPIAVLTELHLENRGFWHLQVIRHGDGILTRVGRFLF